MMLTEENFIGGDGGPMIVLQSSAAAQWKGASEGFDDSLTGGEYVESDYDVICNDSERAIFFYDRDMLILEDSEWGAYISVESGQIVIAQLFSGDSLEDIKQIKQMEPSNSYSFDVQDTSLRLLVGADDGMGGIYGYKDIPIKPGKKQCDIYFNSDFLVAIINQD